MADTFNQVYIQVVFSVKNRAKLIRPSWEQDFHKYIIGTAKKMNQKVLAINGMSDHIHILISLNTRLSIADFVREIKKASTAYIKEHALVKGKFEWQEGYGAFSYNHSLVPKVVEYIKNQKEHHRTKTFEEEYRQFLDLFEVTYQEKHLFG